MIISMALSRSTVDDAETEDSEADPDVVALEAEGLLSMVKKLPGEDDNGGVNHPYPWMKNVRRGKTVDRS